MNMFKTRAKQFWYFTINSSGSRTSSIWKNDWDFEKYSIFLYTFHSNEAY